MADRRWLKTGEIAAEVGRSRTWVVRECEDPRGEFPGARFARQWWIPTKDVKAYREQAAVITASVRRRRKPAAPLAADVVEAPGGVSCNSKPT